MTEFVAGNQVTLLRNGAEYFPALEQAIDSAQIEVHLQIYIFTEDIVGRRIAAAMMRAARRGIKVCLIVDGFGSRDLAVQFVHEMQQSGIHILFYRPKISPWTFKRNRLRRLHRKVVVIDGQLAFIGGINIIDDMNTPGHIPPRIDYAVKVEGAIVAAVHASVCYLWRRMSWARLKRVNVFKTPVARPCGNMWAAYTVRDNILHRNDIEQAYLVAIETARSEIFIANAYFMPGRAFRHALTRAAHRGVRVVLLLQARIEYWLMNYASRALYQDFLEAGVEIHEYHTSFMHSKVAVIDRHWATIGSSNIDPISLWLAHEANVVIDDVAFAEDLRADLEFAISHNAKLVNQADWQRIGLVRRMLTWTTYNLVRFLVGIVGLPDKA